MCEDGKLNIIFAGEHLYELRSPRIKTRNTHGTGCTLASCIAAELAKGSSMLKAVKVTAYVLVMHQAIQAEPIIKISFQFHC